MARLHYVLQPALDVAVARERSALATLHRARAASDAHRVAIDALLMRETELRAGLRAIVRDRPVVASLADADACARGLALRRRRRTATLDKAEDAIRAARAAVASESRRRTALERHRANARETWRLHEDLLDAADLDEANAVAQARDAPARKELA